MSAKKLFAEAKKARLNSHSPYSGYKVGAALMLDNGKVFSGTNIENASYGATICAERVAILKALSEYPNVKIKEIVVLTDSKEAWPPCGMCLQVIAEFATPKTIVHLSNLKGIQISSKFKEFLPLSFSPKHLKK